MAEITLGNAKAKKELTVNIGKNTYKVPLSGSLTLAEVKKIRDSDDPFALFRGHIPDEVIDNLPVDDLRALSEAWKAESEKENQPEPGE